MLMIFYPKGSFDKMVSQKQRSLKILFNIIMGTFNAITDLHKCGIVHNDIKSANILLFEEPDGIITPKLTDFGIAQVVENITLLVTAFEVKSIRGFSLRYAAPERLSKKFTVSPWDKIRVAKSADTYSMGITIWESLCGDKPLF